ncbi:Protein Tob2 [Bagarius yarrelli]|uniref:Protein Tob2 n=1 Tax=Bagarius yarrelli TaxID=175774 RepID=A0A556V7X8_BAGYA|nr:Protein Tob2 [Bagarius yarrelli]
MHLEVKVALNFIVSYLYNKLPRRRADLFGEELERILVSRFKGHWYPEAPLRGSAFRCLHLGVPGDPVVDLAARRSGLDMEEVRANVPPELSIWIDPYEVSYQIGEKGAVKVLYLEDPPGLGGEAEGSEHLEGLCKGEKDLEDEKNLGFNPDAQVFVPIASQVSPVMLASLSNSPTPLCQGLYSYAGSSTPTDPTMHSNVSSPPPPSIGMPYSYPAAKPNPHPSLQQITFTTASFAATKFGSTKMKKCIGSGAVGGSGSVCAPQQRMLSRSPTAMSSISPPGLVKHKPLSLSLHSLAGPAVPSQLSPNAKEFVYPTSQGPFCFEAEVQPLTHTGPFQAQLSGHAHPHATFDPLSSPHPSHVVGVLGGGNGISFMEGLGGYNLQYSSQVFQPVVLAN